VSSTDVRVTGGVVRGQREGSRNVWRGIPYAAPPAGALRFRAPRGVVRWKGVRAATEYGLVGPQVYKGQFTGMGPGVPSGEDCLTINVTSPADAASRLPVMVFIHGGGYSSGSSQQFTGQGESFVSTGQVVYVSFNYRLGALGYLDFSRYSTRRRRLDSNLGLRDQVAALRWVHRNIAAFGGDPHNVTIFGESAGGNAVTTLLATPAARGLFARAIAQSPPSNAVYSRELAAAWAGEFVDSLRERTGDDTTPAIDLLTGSPATQLVTAALTIQSRTPDSYPGAFCFAPTVDGAFLPEHPMRAFQAGRAHRVPLIIGTNDREGTIFRARIDILPRTPARIAALFAQAPAGSAAAIVQCYPGLPAGRAASDFAGDYAFWYPSVKVADYHSRFAPVYSYRFDVAPRLMKWVGLDATHGLEMYALFDQANARVGKTMTVLGGREPFTRAGARMRDSWLRFAVTGTLPGQWPSYTEQDRRTMIIGQDDVVEADPRAERRRAWNDFLPIDRP
jgi:para-nitrobenzyl esterase